MSRQPVIPGRRRGVPTGRLAVRSGGTALAGSSVALGAQTMHGADSGAFTGEVAAPMLSDLGCRFVILGHSERRQLFGETDAGVGEKVQQALGHGLVPIVCVGETLEERDADQAEAVVTRQLDAALDGVDLRRRGARGGLRAGLGHRHRPHGGAG